MTDMPDNPKAAVILLSGGLDSTHALIVAAKAMDRMGRPRSDILAYTMPGFATSDHTKSNPFGQNYLRTPSPVTVSPQHWRTPHRPWQSKGILIQSP